MKLIIIVLAVLIASCGKIEGNVVKEGIAVCEDLGLEWSLAWDGGTHTIRCGNNISIVLRNKGT